jgi:hypothetical protein
MKTMLEKQNGFLLFSLNNNLPIDIEAFALANRELNIRFFVEIFLFRIF